VALFHCWRCVGRIFFGLPIWIRLRIDNHPHTDFNIQPSEPAYRLLTGAPLESAQKEMLALSTVVHSSVDKLSEIGGSEKIEEENEGEVGKDPDRHLTGCRLARPEDGLLSPDELGDLFAAPPGGEKPHSVYGESYGLIESEKGNFYGERAGGMHLVDETGGTKEEDEPSASNASSESASWEEKVLTGYYEPKWSKCHSTPSLRRPNLRRLIGFTRRISKLHASVAMHIRLHIRSGSSAQSGRDTAAAQAKQGGRS
jgi:hypothetical protein